LYGANIEDESNSGKTPLHSACQWGHLPVVKLLIMKGANVSTADVFGMTPLMTSTLRHHFLIVKELLENGANITMKNIHQADALTIARNSKNEDPEMLSLLEKYHSEAITEHPHLHGKIEGYQKLFSSEYYANYQEESSPFTLIFKMGVNSVMKLFNLVKATLNISQTASNNVGPSQNNHCDGDRCDLPSYSEL
jgi:hypothetical protein